jgi:Glycosyl hydrolase family 63 C-terminal domain
MLPGPSRLFERLMSATTIPETPGPPDSLWGPYLSERQWGTVREDYSANGDAWNYFPHDHARSRAYRWGEDGLAGISDVEQRLCFALALWNGQDSILKERLFGLTNGEGNHGEDVKEYYYYLDATPDHSYLKMLYKYPQGAYPYEQLVDENGRRDLDDNEFELIDTGVFDENRYWDVFVEYFKATPEDILIQVTVHNRGPEAATLHLLPQLWFRNTWSWNPPMTKPQISARGATMVAEHLELGTYYLYVEESAELLFCENETNVVRLYGIGSSGYYKDAFHEYLVQGNRSAVNPLERGSKACAHLTARADAGASAAFRLRLSAVENPAPFADFDQLATTRKRQCDDFYARVQSGLDHEDARLVQRQAFAGMIWNKQYYEYDVRRWLEGDSGSPPPPDERQVGRNAEWKHVDCGSIFSMPDKWEYPWFASWDLAFHAVTFSLIDPPFAKHQLIQLLHVWYLHPNGELPAYEWNFSDANPPVHAWAAGRVFEIDRKQRRKQNPNDPGDLLFLEKVFQKLLLNFTWWVNQKDLHGRDLFQGGFLGLDNIGVFNRDLTLPNGAFLSQSDGTSWMAMFTLNLMRIALELAQHNPVYDDMATKFLEHFLYIAEAMTDMGGRGVGLWNENDGFYYDVLNKSDGQTVSMRVRSMVGLIPLFAVETLDPELLEKVPGFTRRMEWFLTYRPDLAQLVSRWAIPGKGKRTLLSLLRGHRMKALLRRMLDPNEFLSDYGVRSVSRYHLEHPYIFWVDGHPLSVDYEPAESRSRLFGGNSNWRGPIWFPMNFLIIEALQKFHYYYGDDFTIECPTGSGTFITIDQVAAELTRRLAQIFLKNSDGERQVNALYPLFQKDENFRDYVPFYEYFDGDNARGAGASHQTGWTGIIAKLLEPRAGYEQT